MEKNGRGRPSHVPSDEGRAIVERLAGFGMLHLNIATAMNITVPTLHKHYRDELDRGAVNVESKLAGHLMRLAEGSGATAFNAIRFVLQCRFGWSPFAPPRELSVGKKEAANIEAQTAHENSDWGTLLN